MLYLRTAWVLATALAAGTLLPQDAVEQPQLDWTGGAPRELWRAKIGWGYSAAVVRGNRLYTTGYSYVVDGHFNTVFCLDTDTGKIIWKDTQGVRASGVFLDPKRGNMPTLIGPRSTPVLEGGFLYVFYQDGKAGCFKAATGQRAWFKNLEKDAATATATLRPACCYAGTPLIKDDMLVLCAGSAGLALSKQTGDLLWTSGPDAAGQASPVLFQQDGKARLAVFSAEQLCTLVLSGPRHAGTVKVATNVGNTYCFAEQNTFANVLLNCTGFNGMPGVDLTADGVGKRPGQGAWFRCHHRSVVVSRLPRRPEVSRRHPRMLPKDAAEIIGVREPTALRYAI